jgi:predicted metal-dependent peptidase
MAADHIINTLLCTESKSNVSLSIPKCIFLVEEFEDKTPTLNEVYLWLKENKQFYDMVFNTETGMVDVYKNGEYVGSFSEDLTGEEFDKELSEEITEELRSELRSALARLKKKGNNSSELFKYLEELVELKLPWDSILENEIKKTRVKSNNNKTWKSLRKKLLHINVTLPSTSTEEVQDHLYIVQDTSGSLWNEEEDQNKFLNLILQSVSYFKSVKIIQHDTEIKSIVDLDQSTFEMGKHKVFELYGGGGTSHNDVFKYIEEKYFAEQEEIGMVILATDYESDVEEIWNNYEFHNFVPVKVLCTTNIDISSSVDPKPIYV